MQQDQDKLRQQNLNPPQLQDPVEPNNLEQHPKEEIPRAQSSESKRETAPPKIKNKCLLARTLWAHDLDQLLVYEKRRHKPLVSPVNPAISATHKKHIALKKSPQKTKKSIKMEKCKMKKEEKGRKTLQQKIKGKEAKKRSQSHSPKKMSPPKQSQKKIQTKQNKSVQDSKQEQSNSAEVSIENEKEKTKTKKNLKPKQQSQQKSFQDNNEVDNLTKKTHQFLITSPTLQLKEQLDQNQKQMILTRPKRNIVRKRYRRYSQDSEFEHKRKAKTIFPISNYMSNSAQGSYLEHVHLIEEIKTKRREQGNILNTKTFINCDVKYFNWRFFIDNVGSFDVVLIDPPWRIKGAQQNDSEFMFSNCKFGLDYKTMSNKDIGNIGIDRLSESGFLFMWILNTQLDASIQIMNKWGYELVDYLVWVKLKDQKVYLTHGYYFMHSYELCLIGYKSSPTKTSECVPKIFSNVLIAEVRKKSQKPDEMYELIEMMFPNQKKIEIYARNNNLRFGWFSLGNQLGQSFDKWLLVLRCDKCHTAISEKMARYKSKRRANYDLCKKCVELEKKQDFYEILNEVNEDIIHLYRECDHCQINPVWGTRFECKVCPDYDLCQNCYDKNLALQPHFHSLDHDMTVVQVPPFAHGFNIHDFKCNSCFQNPIIGIRFTCKQCRSYNLCQMCFFNRNIETSNNGTKIHKPQHQMQAIFCQESRYCDKFQCFFCNKIIYEDCYECKNCYKFFFCGDCYKKKETFKTQMANNHKDYHQFQKIF